MKLIGILEYGTGNLNSLRKILSSLNFRVLTSNDPDILINTDILLLPGVGSFNFAMSNLKNSGLDCFIKDQAKKEKAIIGICLGMQLLADSSTENGINDGLGIIPGKIIKIEHESYHIGWNNIYLEKKNFLSPLNGEKFYFNHGYFYQGNDEYVLGTSNHNESFASIINNKNSYGFQFHPEKSQVNGAKLLKYTIDSIV